MPLRRPSTILHHKTGGLTMLHCNSVGPDNVGSQHRRSAVMLCCIIDDYCRTTFCCNPRRPCDTILVCMTGGHYPAACGAMHHCPTPRASTPLASTNHHHRRRTSAITEMLKCYGRSMAFKPNDQSYGDIHGIVCSHDLILCTRVHLGIPNNVA